MDYIFLEKMDISLIETKWLHENYAKYLNFQEILIYELLVKQSKELNYRYTIYNIVNSLSLDEQVVQNSLRQLMNVKLLEMFKDNTVIFKLNKVKINSEFYALDFVQEQNSINYDNFKSMNINIKQEEKSYINSKMISTWLLQSNINLSLKDIEKLNNFNKIHNLNTIEIVKLVKKTYNEILREVNIDKMNFEVTRVFNINTSLSSSIKSFVKKCSKGLYAEKDLQNFVKLIEKHTNLNDEQLRAIIYYVYKTQKNVYFNFIDKLAISILKENAINYESALEVLNKFVSKAPNKNFTKKSTSFAQKDKKEVKIDIKSLKRDNKDGEGISLDDLLGNEDD